jgi:hypothetical protein
MLKQQCCGSGSESRITDPKYWQATLFILGGGQARQAKVKQGGRRSSTAGRGQAQRAGLKHSRQGQARRAGVKKRRSGVKHSAGQGPRLQPRPNPKAVLWIRIWPWSWSFRPGRIQIRYGKNFQDFGAVSEKRCYLFYTV